MESSASGDKEKYCVKKGYVDLLDGQIHYRKYVMKKTSFTKYKY